MEDTWESTILVYINGKAHRIANPDPAMTLLTYLRSQGLTGVLKLFFPI